MAIRSTKSRASARPKMASTLSTASSSPPQSRSRSSRLGREEPCVGRKIELGAVVSPRDEKPCEAGIHLDALDGEAGRLERAFCGRNQPVDRLTGKAEEVEIARLALDFVARDQRRSASERESFGLVQTRDDLRDGPLQCGQHLWRARVLTKPPGPRPPYRRWKDELIEQLGQPIRIDIEADVVGGPFTEHLLVDAGSVSTVFEVVGDRRPAPPNVQGQLHPPARLGQGRIVEVGRHGYRACGGPEFLCACARHLPKSLRSD